MKKNADKIDLSQNENGERASKAKRVDKAPRLPRWGSYAFAVAIFLLVFLASSFALSAFLGWAGFVAGAIAGVFFASAVRIAYEWERVVILRFGRFSRTVNPGVYFTFPLVEQVVLHVDQRIEVTPFLDEHALTSDLAPVDVDAVVFWMVWDAKQAYTQVVNYPEAVSWSAQTALRDAIGKINLADVPMKRKQIDHEVQAMLEEKVSDWGISIISVEIRDITVPGDLQAVMSKAAQAEREHDARIALAEAEKEVARIFIEAADAYEGNELALRLRSVNLLYDGIKDKGATILIPSSLADSIGEIEKSIEKLR